MPTTQPVTNEDYNIVRAPNPGTIGIPFVFNEIRGEGRPLNLTWYESENS